MLGKLLLNYNEVYSCNIRTNVNRIRGYYKARDEESRDAWTRERYFTTAYLNTQLKKPIKPRDLVVFPWEPKQEPVQLSAKQFLKLIDGW